MAKFSKPVLLFGAGGLAADIADIVVRAWDMPVAGFVVDRPSDEGAAKDAPPYCYFNCSWGASELASITSSTVENKRVAQKIFPLSSVFGRSNQNEAEKSES